MADLYASRQPVRLNDGTADANNAVIANAAPGSSDYALVTRLVGLPAAAALADNFANPTTVGVGAFAMAWDGANWDRVPGSSTGGLVVDLGANNDVTITSGTVTADTELTVSDLDTGGGTDNRAVVGMVLAASGGGLLVGAANPMPVSDNGASLTVDGTVAISGTVTVDSELPAAAALTDNFANPTAPAVGAFLMGWDGATWDRVAVANSGRLQVDVITGASTAPASGVPTGHDLLSLYGTSAALAGGGTATAVVTNTPANTKDAYVTGVSVKASGASKFQVKFGATVLYTGFNSQSTLDSGMIPFNPPLTITGDGATALTVDIVSREASAMDVYASLRGYVEQ